MPARLYYTLMAALPSLPYFEGAEVLPIGRERLYSRLRMLHPEDLADVQRVRRLVGWREYPATRTDAQVAAQYRVAWRETDNPALRAFLEFRIGMRTAMAGLRRRQKGLGPPTGDGAMFHPIARRVAVGWERTNFGLTGMFPWLEEARQLLAAGSARDLELLLLRDVWRYLRRTGDTHRPFSFEQVFCYVFHWSVLNRWVSYDAEGAAARFKDLIEEVIDGHDRLFG